LRASLWFSPRPAAWAIRQLFVRTGRQTAARLAEGAPDDVSTVVDERYGASASERLDVYRPADAPPALPTLVWTHGGAFVGGSKEEIGGYLRRIAAAGFTVVGLEYALAPAAHYPTPVRQVMAALAHLQAYAVRLGVDPERIMLAGDSAGAHITAQVAAIITSAPYAAEVGVEPTLATGRLRAVALFCGVYDIAALYDPASPLRDLVAAVGWSYSGHRNYREDERFRSATAVAGQVGPGFPPAFVTVGNADPLAGQSRTLVEALRANGVTVESLFYPDDHHPPLGHEYQFDLATDAGRQALACLVDFLRTHGAGTA
jgi:acetyl esterase/lipase